jgi:hypothetical protein
VLKSQATARPEVAIKSAVVDGILWLTVRGPLTPEVGDALLARIEALTRINPYPLRLLDFRAAALVEGTVSLIGHVNAVDASEHLRTGRIAILCAVRTNAYAFLEATSVQHGHDLKVFTDGARAMEWLRSDSPT